MHGHFATNKTARTQEKNQMENPKLLVALDKAVDLVVIRGSPIHTSHMWLARSVLDQKTRIRVDTSGRKKIKPNAVAHQCH